MSADQRPENCRFRLQDEGKSYPRSSCTACGRTITTGLGRRCHYHVAGEMTMNEPIVRNNVQIVAVVFCNLDKITHSLIVQEKPYFYLDTHRCNVGDYALVHNGENFGVVRVMRLLPTTDAVAVSRITKPILCRIEYDAVSLRDISVLLEEYKKNTTDQRIQKVIDRELDDTLYLRRNWRKKTETYLDDTE